MTPGETHDQDYADHLARSQSALWKRALGVQLPYRRYLRGLHPGFTLDVGCGVGRNLGHLDGKAVGVDHSERAVAIARARGFLAFTPEEFSCSPYSEGAQFDTLLCSHVIEHMSREKSVELIGRYLRNIRTGGRVVLISPQESGHRRDPTHVRFVDFDALSALVADLSLTEVTRRSFPFPRPVGRLFPYNEFVVVARVE